MDTVMMRGKPVADACREQIAQKIEKARKNGLILTLAIIVVGNDPASHVYKDHLVQLLRSLGGAAKVILLPEDTPEERVVAVVKKLNRNRYVHGILPMKPLPAHINGDTVGAAIAMNKDVDCMNPQGVGEVFLGGSYWSPCTPRACMAVLEHYGIDPAGKEAVIVGRSNVVGKPLAILLLQKNATVTICHSKTADLAAHLRRADLVVAAVGIPGFIKPEMVQEGAVVVDVGINEVDGKIVGDVDPAVAEKVSAFTPVPGGIGVVSNMMLMECLSRRL